MSTMLIRTFKEREGYSGTIEYDTDSEVYFGHVSNIDEDVQYHGF